VPSKATTPDPKEILAGLRKALSGRCLLKGTDDEAMFPGGAKGAKLIQAAKDLDYLVVETETNRVGRKSVKKEFGVLTGKGREYVLRTDDPKPILESLLTAMARLAAPARSPNPDIEQKIHQARDSCKKAVEDSAAACQLAIEKACAQHTQASSKALSQLETSLLSAVVAIRPIPIDAASISSAIEGALQRLNQPNPRTVTSPTRSDSGTDHAELQAEIIAQVDQWHRSKSTGVPFDELWNRLRPRFATLQIGEFHDALRQLFPSRIRLSGWGRVHDEMPAPELALFISTKVMYYAHPAHANE
jgi:hypothetical protein